MPITRGYSAPPQGRGYYDRTSGRWWDSHVGHFLPLGDGADQMEVHVEEVTDDSWLGRRLPAVAKALRAPRYRFVGHAVSDDPRWPSYRVVGDVFATGRARLLGGGIDARPWAPEVLAHLNDFAAYLFERGWLPEGHGENWWSLVLSRPCVQWPLPDTTTLNRPSPAAHIPIAA